MKIYFDSVVFELQKRGGVSNYWLEFMNRFIKEENCFFFVNKEDGYLNKQFLDFMHNNQLSTLSDKCASGSILRVLLPPKINSRDNDKIIFHSTAYRWNKAKNVKNIITIHDFTHQKYMNFYHRFINSWLKRRAIKHADGIVCISENTHKDLLSFYPKLKNKKVVVINNGFDSKVFRHIDNLDFPLKYKVLDGKKYILFVGQRDGYKNFNFMLDILNKTNDLYLVVVGGKNFDYTEINQQIRNRIITFNEVEDEELNILYNMSFCFIYPSLYEGFGLPICEAMNCGCPVIAFNNSSIPEVMNGAGILVENNDINSVINELNKLNDLNYREYIITQQYLACKKFSWDKAYDEMKKFYLEV